MFGIFYALWCSLSRIRLISKKYIDDTEAKNRTFDSFRRTYRDSQSKTYDALTDQQLFYMSDKNHHEIYVNKNGTIRRDITELKIKNEIERLRNNPDSQKTVVRLGTEYENYRNINDLLDGITGYRMYDVQTGDIYVIRNFTSKKNLYYKHHLNDKADKIPSVSFYMNISNGMLVRVADCEYDIKRQNLLKLGKTEKEIQEKIKTEKELAENWIKEFNQHQIEKMQSKININNPSDYFENNYCGVLHTKEV